jgi:hypothetical protein
MQSDKNLQCSVRLDMLHHLLPQIRQLAQTVPVEVIDHEGGSFFIVSPDLLTTTRLSLAVNPLAVNLLSDQVASIQADSIQTVPQLTDNLMEQERLRVERGEFAQASWHILRNRLDRHILPAWGHLTAQQLNRENIGLLVQRLTAAKVSATTFSQYMVIARKLLLLAKQLGWIDQVPDLPKILVAHKPRSTFSLPEYRSLLRTAKRLTLAQVEAPPMKTSDGQRQRFWVTQRYRTLPWDMYALMIFMVNGFIRPSDIKTLRHRHVQVVRGEHNYLRLNLPETKKHDKPIVTLQPAVRIYKFLVNKRQQADACKPDDWIFLPKETDREHALGMFNFWLKWILRESGLPLTDNHAQVRTLYCLRHTCITFRLLYGQGIDMLTLARNARTSVDMIEKFYASTLTGEMNIAMLQSRRSSKKSR